MLFSTQAGEHYRENKHKKLKEILNPHGTIIDVGCATGYTTNFLHNLGLDAIGIDVSPEMIRYAAEKYPHLRFCVCSAEEMSRVVTGVDYVYIAGVLSEENADNILDECHRTLKNNGKVVIVVSRGSWVWRVYDVFHRSLPSRSFTRQSLIHSLAKHGFEVESCCSFGLVPYNCPQKLLGLALYVEKIFGDKGGFSLFTVARKTS